MPSDDALEIPAGKALGLDELERRAENIQLNESFRDRLITVFESLQEVGDPSPHVEEQIYDGFPSFSDRQQMERFHQVPWDERLELVQRLEDRRMLQLGKQLLYFERPHLIEKRTRMELDSTFTERLMSTDSNLPWLTLPKAIEKVDSLIATVGAAERELLLSYRAYFVQRKREWPLSGQSREG